MPKKFLLQMLALVGLSSFMTVFGTVVAESAPNGVSVYFIFSVIGITIIAVLWKRFNLAPLRCVSVFVALGAIGFVLAIVSISIPGFALAASALLGLGMMVCFMSSYFMVVILRLYPSKYIMLLVFVIAVATISFSREKIVINNEQIEKSGEQPTNIVQGKAKASTLWEQSLEKLNYHETRITELILSGYSYTEIASVLKLKSNTVKWYQKELYSKLGINSKRELFELAAKRNK